VLLLFFHLAANVANSPSIISERGIYENIRHGNVLVGSSRSESSTALREVNERQEIRNQLR